MWPRRQRGRRRGRESQRRRTNGEGPWKPFNVMLRTVRATTIPRSDVSRLINHRSRAGFPVYNVIVLEWKWPLSQNGVVCGSCLPLSSGGRFSFQSLWRRGTTTFCRTLGCCMELLGSIPSSHARSPFQKLLEELDVIRGSHTEASSVVAVRVGLQKKVWGQVPCNVRCFPVPWSSFLCTTRVLSSQSSQILNPWSRPPAERHTISEAINTVTNMK